MGEVLFDVLFKHGRASLVAQLVKNPPAMQVTWVRSLSWEDPLEKGKATPGFWPREFHRLYNSWGHRESDMTERLSLSLDDKVSLRLTSTNLCEMANMKQCEQPYCMKQKTSKNVGME